MSKKEKGLTDMDNSVVIAGWGGRCKGDKCNGKKYNKNNLKIKYSQGLN